jgi:hypothetical protein
MASLSQAFVSHIATVSPVTTLVSTRVYPQYQRLADKVFPALVYKIDQTTTFNTYDGAAANQLVSSQIVIAAIGQTYSSAEATANAVQAALDGTSGTWNGVTIQGVFLQEDGITDDVVTEAETEEIIYHIREMNFQVWWVNS